MKNRIRIKKIVIAGLLSAVGIAIPLISPIKILIEPASFTLASHVAIFVAMFISPAIAIAVTFCTALGFFFTFPLVIALRALSHIVFAVLGSLFLKRNIEILSKPFASLLFNFTIAIIHALCEVVVVTVFYAGNSLSQPYYQNGYAVAVLLLVGVGTMLHSMVDYYLSVGVWKILNKTNLLALE